jgi:putative hydrolase of the HAD superfamily
MIKAIFFDLDGVLTTDAKGSLTMSKNLCEAKAGLVVDEVLKSFRTDIERLTSGQCSLQSVIERLCSEFGIPFSEELLIAVASKTPWNKPMVELAHSLMSAYVVGVITDNGKERMDMLSRAPELSGFNPIVVSAAERASKSDGSTTIYDRALIGANCFATEALFVDNQERNLVIPAKMGMHTYFHDDARNDMSALYEAFRALNIEV